MSVFVKPGAIVLTLILLGPSSLDNTLACDIKAAFVDTYELLPSLPSIAELDEILTILPRFFFYHRFDHKLCKNSLRKKIYFK